MKKIIIAMAAIAAAFTMASCSKEQLTESEGTPVVGNDVITAFTEGTLTKTSLSGDDAKGYDVVWSDGDQIKIGSNIFTLTEGANTTSGKFQGTLPEGDGPFKAYYPTTYNGTDWPTSQTYAEGNITGSPMTADVEKGAESLSFKNEGGILRLTLKGTAKVRFIKVKADNLDEITLDCRSGVSLDADGTAFHIAMPEGEYSGVSISIWTPDFDYCTKKLKEGKNLVINKSEITTASFTADFPDPTPVASLDGAFSIAEGKQVCFSKGNLRYTVGYDSGEWSFFDKQYKCGPLNTVREDEISLFTWGYNATESIRPTGTSSNNVSITSGNLSQTQDWGSVIGDGKTWRTLTSAEWTYLFEGRIDADKKYGYGTIGNIPGLIILPDEFTDPMKNGGSGAFKPQSSTASSWTDNMYTLAGNWEAMEAAGAVFLPAAGRRSGSTIATGSNEQGHYWSSTASESGKAYFVHFNNGTSFDPAYSWNRGNGCSVRLVTDLYTVTFDMNGKEGTVPESFEMIPHGSTITMPSDPITDGYEFKGWYKDKECTTLWDFDTDVVTANITLYAKWMEWPDEVISGTFSVSETKKVYFSSGNLWCDKNGTFNFEANQYDFTVSWDEGSPRRSDEHVSHFIWCNDVSIARALSCGTTPLNSSTVLFTNSDETHPNPDFTVNGQKGLWRTLSIAEWTYLINNNGSLWTSINGVNGLIIFSNEYKGEKTDLTEIPEGCVFLPAAGYRYATPSSDGPYPIDGIDKTGHYWSSTNENRSNAYDTSFNSSRIGFGSGIKGAAYAIRLVADTGTVFN